MQKQAVYATLNGPADPPFSTLAMQDTADRPVEYPCLTVEKLLKFLISTILGFSALKAR